MKDICILIKYLFFKFQCIGLPFAWYKFLHMVSGKVSSSVFLFGNPIIAIQHHLLKAIVLHNFYLHNFAEN